MGSSVWVEGRLVGKCTYWRDGLLRLVSRPGAPEEGQRGSERGGKQGLRHGLDKGKAKTRAYRTEWNLLIGTTEWKGRRPWEKIERSIWENVAIVVSLRRDGNFSSDRRFEVAKGT